MAVRATAQNVKDIKPDTTFSDSVILDSFIAAATLVVDRVAAACSDLSDGTLTQIEIWYSAHLISVHDGVLVKEKFEGAENTYQRGGTGGTGVMSTQYGQMANTLSSGCLEDEDRRTPAIAFA
ncbi:MAG: hypothetical protein KAJ19_10485 [Gammaproteobacteria bacterium]|nr:hypothetical protein [Gammaproteobacteria bacterium]